MSDNATTQNIKKKYFTGVSIESLSRPTINAVHKTLVHHANLQTKDINDTAFPKSYSTVLVHPQCRFGVRNQGECGSCWAVTAADVLTDRACIQYGSNIPFSAQPLVSCTELSPNSNTEPVMYPWESNSCPSGKKSFSCLCSESSDTVPAPGCFGNSMYAAWDYLKKYGTVPLLEINGDVGASISCKTFCEMAAGYHPAKESARLLFKSIGKPINVSDQDSALHENIANMKRNIIKYGPIQGAFSVYKSFNSFFEKNPTGVYVLDPSGGLVGGHTSKIVGWGVDNNKEYWILQNTWGNKWGDNGFYKMAFTTPDVLNKFSSDKYKNVFVLEYNSISPNILNEGSVRDFSHGNNTTSMSRAGLSMHDHIGTSTMKWCQTRVSNVSGSKYMLIYLALTLFLIIITCVYVFCIR